MIPIPISLLHLNFSYTTMKTNPPALLRRLFLTGLSLSALTVWAGENSTTSSVKLSAPGKPATLRINLPWADIHLSGVDSDTVTVESSVGENGPKKNRDAGLRRLDDETNFVLTENNNVVSLTLANTDPAAGGNNAAFNISMPRTMALDLRTELGGDVMVKDIAGDIEINNTNGAVRLEGIAGSTVVNTMNGEVHANYTKAPNTIVSITSQNGEVDLRVPSDTKANVQLRSLNGSILTDFDKAKLKTKAKSRFNSDKSEDQTGMAADTAKDSRSVVPSFTGGKLVSGTLNGGGVDIKISTMNGKIMLRQNDRPVSASDNTGTKDNVTVTFQDPDNFTDVAEDFPNSASEYYLNELRDCVQKEAALRLPAGSKLSVTFTDIDLAGMLRPDRNNVRLMTSTTIPRAQLKFQLVGADGQVLQEGERKLSDMNYQMSIGIIGRNEPLYYDKELLKDWIAKEFKPRS